jgi:Uma2 family endonuclease
LRRGVDRAAVGCAAVGCGVRAAALGAFFLVLHPRNQRVAVSAQRGPIGVEWLETPVRGMLPHVSTSRRLHHSYEEYLRLQELSAVKLEYCEGEIYAMAGGTPAHADLAASITRLLGNVLLGRCRVSSSDLRIRVEATDLSTFPDVTVVCEQRQLSTLDRHAVANPTLLVEVTSNSTEDYDRGEKLGHYKQLPSLKAAIFVSHRRPHVTIVERSSEGWQQREYRAGETVILENPGLEFGIDELYAGIELDEQ